MLNIPEEVKDLCKQDSVRKNFRVRFPHGEHDDLTNENIEFESVTFSESVCSRNELRFGLCEGSSISFVAVGIGNIKDMTISAMIEIDVSSLDPSWISEHGVSRSDLDYPVYPIPYGEFIVDSCERDSGNLQKRTVEAISRVAQEKWTLNRFSAELLNRYVFKYERNPISFSVESLLALMFPESLTYSCVTDNTPFEDGDGWWIHMDDINGKMYRMYTYAKSAPIYTTEDTGYEWTVLAYKTVFDDEYLYKVRQLRKLLQSKNVNVKSERFRTFDYWLMPEALEYYKYSISKGVKTLKAHWGNMTMGGLDSLIIEHELNYLWPKNEIISHVLPRDKQYVTNTSTVEEYWVNVLRDSEYLNPTVPCRLILQYFDETTKEWVDEFDTGEYMNSVWAATPVPTSTSASGFYIPVGGMYADTLCLTDYDTTAPVTTPGYATYFSPEISQEIIESFLELQGVFGFIGRDGTFKTLSVASDIGLYPSDTLYPSNDIVPGGADVRNLLRRANYKTAWYADEKTKPYGRVECNYTDLDGNSKYKYIDLVESYNESDYLTYSISDNYFIVNYKHAEETILGILVNIGCAIKTVQYMPAEIESQGLPYLEAGDVIQVITEDGGFETLILRRTLNGIQMLEDIFESRG